MLCDDDPLNRLETVLDYTINLLSLLSPILSSSYLFYIIKGS